MSSPYAVNELLEDLAEACGIQSFPVSGSFCTQAQALKYLRRGAEKLTGLLHKSMGANYFVRTGTVATQVGLTFVSLPADFFTLSKIAWIRSATEKPQDLEEASMRDVESVNSNPRTWQAPPKYTLMGNTIGLWPCPAAVYNLLVVYSTKLVVGDAGDTTDLQPLWAEFLVLDAAVKIYRKEKRDPTELYAERADVQKAIESQQSQRDHFGVKTVQDMRGGAPIGNLDRGPRWGSGAT